jgi:hypothetical protein
MARPNSNRHIAPEPTALVISDPQPDGRSPAGGTWDVIG